MNDQLPASLVVGENDRVPVADRSDLIPHVNRAFLITRQIVPIGLDEERLLCLAVDPADRAAQDAMRFASGRDVILLAASSQTITAAFDQSAQTPARIKESLGPLASIPHAREVVWLRELLTQVTQSGGDALLVQRSGGTVIRKGQDDIDATITSPAQAQSLIAAIDALTDAHVDREGEPGFDIVFGTNRQRVYIVTAPDYRIVQLRTS